MACKIVELLIDNSVEHELNQSDHDMVQNHLNTCDACKKYYLDTIKVDGQLKNLFATETLEKDVTFDVMSEIHSLKKKSKKKPVILSLAASLLILLCFQFNTEIYAFAEKLPFIADLLEYFKSEEGVAYAKDHDYETFDFYTDQKGYKLYIEDIFMDESLFSLQFSIEDQTGKALSDYDWAFEMTSENGHWTMSKHKQNKVNPWQKIDFWSAELRDIPEVLNMNITVETLGLEFKDIEINTSELKTYDAKIIQLDEELQTEVGTIEFKTFTISPSSMYLKYQIKENENYQHLRFIGDHLVDSSNQTYNYSYHTAYAEDKSISLKYDSSIYFEDGLDYIKLLVEGFSYRKHESYGQYTEDDVIGLQYVDDENNAFTITSFEKDRMYRNIVITSNEALNEYDFPALSLKLTDGSWQSFHPSSERITYEISKIEIEKLLNSDLETLLDNQLSETFLHAKETLINYCKNEYDVVIDEKKASQMMWWLKEDDEYLLSSATKVTEMTYSVNSNDSDSNEIGEILELSFSESEHIIFDENYELIIELD